MIGIALAIGLNELEPECYSGWSGALKSCESDAHDMAGIAESKRFKIKTLLTKEATRFNVINAISNAADALISGDIFMMSYSGYGGQISNLNYDEITDYFNKTWCLYDGQFIDDELYAQLAKFKSGVRILIIVDSSYSGTETNAANLTALKAAIENYQSFRTRNMPIEICDRVYRDNQSFYDEIFSYYYARAKQDINASVLIIYGCQENQTSAENDANGLFTSSLIKVWHNGQFWGNYRRFHRDILNRMPPYQTPGFDRLGKIEPMFERQRPFKI